MSENPMSSPYPRYYAVNDRPVKIVELPDGGSDALAFDWLTGGFAPDRSYFERTGAHGKDIDQLTEEKFTVLVRVLREPIVKRLCDTPLTWEHTGDGEVPFRTTIGERVRAALIPSVTRMTSRYVDVADAMYAAEPTSAPVVRREQVIASAPDRSLRRGRVDEQRGAWCRSRPTPTS